MFISNSIPIQARSILDAIQIWMKEPATLEAALRGEVVTGFYTEPPWFLFRLRSGKVFRINPEANFSWEIGKRESNQNVWISLPSGLRIDRIMPISRHNHPGLRFDCSGMVSSSSLMLIADRAGVWRLAFPKDP